MTTASADRLYELLPALYRERDEAEGYPLRVLLRTVEAQLVRLEGNMRRFYDDLFIETCDAWVLTYLADLVGNDLLYDSTRVARPDSTELRVYEDLVGPDFRPPMGARARADVANTIAYRRRKGTLAMLEELARNVTGWPAHAVEFFEHVGWTQHVEHLRPQSRWLDMRALTPLARLRGPFDTATWTPDVRAISQLDGWHGIHNVGFFLWRLQALPLVQVPARPSPSAPWHFSFNPLGATTQLFTRWQRLTEAEALATRRDVPAPIRRSEWYDDLAAYGRAQVRGQFATDLYGPFTGPNASAAAAFAIEVDSAVIEPAVDHRATPTTFVPVLVCGRLDPWPATRPIGRRVVVDVATGRIALGSAWGTSPQVDVSFYYGSPASLGGGTYPRERWLIREGRGVELHVRTPSATSPAAAGTYASVGAALQDWVTLGRPNTVIRILDSRTYDLPAAVELSNEHWLVIEAASGTRPLLCTDGAGLTLGVAPPAAAGDPARKAALTLSGVLVEGSLRVTGDLGTLRLLHTTLVPGQRLSDQGAPLSSAASVWVAPTAGGASINAQLRLEIAYAISGPLVVPDHVAGVFVTDSIIDGIGGLAIAGSAGTGASASSMCDVRRTTVFGGVRVKQLEASEAIFTGRVIVERVQQGCVRFSFVPPESRTPRRFQCQPDREVAQEIDRALAAGTTGTVDRVAIRRSIEAWLRPSFASDRYGDADYAQLQPNCPAQIQRGCEDGSEMGALAHLKQAQREDNLRLRLREYLPFGLDGGVIYAT